MSQVIQASPGVHGSPAENLEEHGSSVALFLPLFGVILICVLPETSSQQTRMFRAPHTQASVINEINLSESKSLSFIFFIPLK